MLQRKIEDEKRSKGKPKNIDEDFLIKTPKIRMDIIGVTRAQQRYFDQMFIWYKSINEQIRSMMKAGTTQQKLLVLMDNYIQSLRTNSNTFVRNANRCYLLSKAISSALFLFKDLNRTSTETDEYLLKICELLSFYTFLELKFSSKFSSSKVIIAERISSNYDIHLKDVNIFYTLRVFLCIPTLFNEKEIMSKIFQKYLNRHPQITQRKLPDRLYCMYLMSYSKWLSLENDNYERIKICESANKNVQPMESLRLNKSYAPFLPVYEHTDSNATKYILSHRINLKLLTKVLKNDVCRKENIVLIDLSGSDLTNTSNILEDSSWTSILTSEKSTSVKLESPSIIATIDLTEEQSSSWEVSWLSELIRKSRASMPRNTLNVIPPKLVHTFEVINIEDDDEHCGETVGTLSFNSNECEENLKSIVRTKMVDGNNSNIKTGSTEGTKLVPERNGKENNLVFNDKAQEKINQNSIQDMQEKGNLHSDMIMKNLMVNNSTNKTVKIRERHKDYLPQCQPDRSALWTKVSYSAASAKNFELHTDKKTDTSKNLTNVPVEQSDPSKSFSTYNNLIPANSSRVINIENCKSTSAISTNEEDVEDINSPPVECFSESDADELVQLIDKNTKDSNGTNLFYNRKNHHNSISQISNSHKVSVSNSQMRKVSFAKLPEKHIAASSHFSAKNLRNVDQTETEKECNQSTILSPNNTTLSPNNTILPNSDLNFNQPKALSNSLEIASQSSSVQEIVSSTDRTSLPIADLNRQNKISGTIGSLFMMKFPQPTYQKLDNFDITKKKKHIFNNGCEESRTDLYKTKNYTLIKKNDNKNYLTEKKYKSDFDRYLEKLKEKRSKTKQNPKHWIHHKPLYSQIDTFKQKEKTENIFNIDDVKKNVDEKLHKKSYVKLERINFTQYVPSKLKSCHMLEEQRANQLISTNPYVRIKRIKNIKETLMKSSEYTAITNQQVCTSKVNSSSKKISEINSTCNIVNTVRHNTTATESKNNKNIDKKIDKKISIYPIKPAKKSCIQQEVYEKIVISQSERPATYQNTLDRLNSSDINDYKLKDLENEVTSTQDYIDILEEYKISSTQDILNKELCNSVQNSEIDTSQQVLVRQRGKRKFSVDHNTLLLSKKNTFYNRERNFFIEDSDNGTSNNEADVPTTTTLTTSPIKKGRKKHPYIKKTSKKAKKQNSIRTDIVYTKNNEIPSLTAKKYSVFGDYQADNSTIAKTYSKHNLVSNVFVPPEIEKNFDDLN